MKTKNLFYIACLFLMLSLSGCKTEEVAEVTSPGSANIIQAYSLMESGEYDAAKELFSSMYASDEGLLEALIGLADCEYQLKNYEEAIGYYNTLLEKEQFTNSSKVLSQKVRAEILSSKLEDALNNFYDFTAKEGMDTSLYELIRNGLYANEKNDELIQLYDFLAQQDEEASFTYELSKLEIMVRQNKLDDAKSCIQSIENEQCREMILSGLEAYELFKNDKRDEAVNHLLESTTSLEQYEGENFDLYLGDRDDEYQKSGSGLELDCWDGLYLGDFAADKRNGYGYALKWNRYTYDEDEDYNDMAYSCYINSLEGVWENDYPNGVCTYMQKNEEYRAEGEPVYTSMESVEISFVDGRAEGRATVRREYHSYDDGYRDVTNSECEFSNGAAVKFDYQGQSVYSISVSENDSYTYTDEDYPVIDNLIWR